MVALVVGPGHAAAAPGNDLFANAITTTSVPFMHTLDTAGATVEVAEDANPCSPVGSTVWYRFIAPTAAAYQADTLGSSFDTVIAVYTGSTLASLTVVGCNDDALGTVESELVFAGTAGTTYYLQAGGFDGESGYLTVNVSAVPPVNDAFASASYVTTLPFAHDVSTSGATTEAAEPLSCGPTGKTVWYRFSPANDALYRINTAGSDFAPAIAIYGGSAITGLLPTSCAIEGSAEFVGTSGQEYRIQVGGVAGNAGHLALTLVRGAPSHDAFAAARVIAVAPYSNITHTVDASEEPQETLPCGTGTIAIRCGTPSRRSPVAGISSLRWVAILTRS